MESTVRRYFRPIVRAGYDSDKRYVLFCDHYRRAVFLVVLYLCTYITRTIIWSTALPTFVPARRVIGTRLTWKLEFIRSKQKRVIEGSVFGSRNCYINQTNDQIYVHVWMRIFGKYSVDYVFIHIRYIYILYMYL